LVGELGIQSGGIDLPARRDAGRQGPGPGRVAASPQWHNWRMILMRILPPALALGALCADPEREEAWAQFRGPNSTGVSASTGLPLTFGPERGVVWRTPVPPGKSSPVFAGDRIFLTAAEGESLLTLCLDRRSGGVRWRRSITRSREEKRHKLNDPAAATPVTDGRNVYAFFPDFGLVSYDGSGKERWKLPLPPMPSMQGVAASPVLSGDRLLLVVDQAQGSYMMSLSARNGETQWRRERRPAPGGAYSSPVVFQPPGEAAQLVTFSPFEVAGFSVETGEKLWWFGGLPPQPKATPLVAGGTIYVYARSFFGDGLPVIPPFQAAIETSDRDKDGRISKEEAPEGPAKQFYGVVDRNKDGLLDAAEWAGMMEAAAPKSSVTAIRPRGRGDLTSSAAVWRLERNIPDVPTPVLYRDSLYMVQNGGIVTTLDPATGAIRRQGRLTGALGDYYASPVAADGKVYFTSREGKIAVVRAAADWELLAVNDLGEECFATPAITGGDLYVRTAAAMYRFSAAP